MKDVNNQEVLVYGEDNADFYSYLGLNQIDFTYLLSALRTCLSKVLDTRFAFG